MCSTLLLLTSLCGGEPDGDYLTAFFLARLRSASYCCVTPVARPTFLGEPDKPDRYGGEADYGALPANPQRQRNWLRGWRDGQSGAAEWDSRRPQYDRWRR